MTFHFPAGHLTAGRGKVHAPAASSASNSRTLDDRAYIVGQENHLLPVVIDDFLRAEARLSPQVIYGPVGSGKTHLAELIAAKWNALVAAQSVGELSPVTIVRATDLVAGSRGNATPFELAKHAPVIFLNVDDLARNARWQNKMSAALDDWKAEGRRVLLTSRVHPGEIAGLDARLRSRLVAGLCVGLEPPQLATRKALLTHWANVGNIRITPGAVAELARTVEGMPARLRGAFWQLAMACQAADGEDAAGRIADKSNSAPITEHAVRRFLQGEVSAQADLSISLIARTTARHFNTTLADLRSPSRRKSTVLARSIAMYLARSLTGNSLTEIGKFFGNRDHTTVMHSCRKIETEKNREPDIAEAVRHLAELLRVGV